MINYAFEKMECYTNPSWTSSFRNEKQLKYAMSSRQRLLIPSKEAHKVLLFMFHSERETELPKQPLDILFHNVRKNNFLM